MSINNLYLYHHKLIVTHFKNDYTLHKFCLLSITKITMCTLHTSTHIHHQLMHVDKQKFYSYM